MFKLDTEDQDEKLVKKSQNTFGTELLGKIGMLFIKDLDKVYKKKSKLYLHKNKIRYNFATLELVKKRSFNEVGI